MTAPWPATEAALVAAQHDLLSAHPDRWRPPHRALAVAGCFVCNQRGRSGAGAAGDPAWAGAALITDDHVEIAVVTGVTAAAYVPGLLALRDGPLLETAVRRLPARPDVLLVNATAGDHPRGAGLALHLGARLDLPTIGVTSRPLLAEGGWPADEPAATSPLRIDGDVVACWLRLRRHVRPLVVHPGWRIDLETAVVVVAATTRDARTPEPLRQARRAAREARARDAAAGDRTDPHVAGS